MLVIRQLIDFCLDNVLLSSADVDTLVAKGLYPRWEGCDPCYEDCVYGDEFEEFDPNYIVSEDEEEQNRLERGRAVKRCGRPGQARKRWWKGYQVGQLARRRRLMEVRA